ncbi:tetratricopeptide repeat protein [Sinobacterium caligoides]|uniref:Tetratricopeptide repeat protein n=1 Tax=Sinobacterium caligoides TaxID=933926 RepID=A0A3N2E116_9GAMM|nr:tetratricopeptide repeat protein [Sinobacterium caligoides]ROS05776.1 tetratricopeptide repeat protein [Sinobacterium caligoides]
MNRTLYLLTALSTSLLLSACSGLTDKAEPTVSASSVEVSNDVPSRPFEADTLYALLVAEVAGARQQYDIALGNYLQQAHKTRDPQIAARAARLAQYLNAQQVALDASQLWAEIAPDSSEAHYMAAVNLSQAGQVDAAFDHMQQVETLGGTTNFPLIAATSLKLTKTQTNQLLARFQQALEQQPHSEQLLLGKAILQQQHDPEVALDTVQEVLDRSPDNLRALSIQTAVLYQLGRGEAAAAIFEQALADNPDNVRLRLQYARQLTKTDLAQARQQFTILAQQAPEDSDILYSLALIDYELKDYNSAEAHFQQLHKLQVRADDANLYLGLVQEQKKNPDAAIGFYRQVVPGQNYMQALQSIARLWNKQGKSEQFHSLMTTQRQQYPEQAVPLFLLEADLLQRQKHYAQAIELLNDALSQRPKEANLLYSRSLINEKLGRLDDMEADLRTLIAQDPENAAALNALGYVLINYTNRLSEASELIHKALKLQPNDPAILDSMGWLLLKQGKTEQSLSYLKSAYQAYPDAEVAAHFGEALWQANLRAEAKAVWLNALKRQPDDSTLLKTIKRLAPDLLKP